MIVKSIYDFLISQTSITKYLGLFDFGGGTLKPCIFTYDPPFDSPFPYILVSTTDTNSWGSRGYPGGKVTIVIEGTFSKGYSPYLIRKLGTDCWRLLNRKTDLNVQGVTEGKALVIANLPILITNLEGFPGFEMSLEVSYSERSV